MTLNADDLQQQLSGLQKTLNILLLDRHDALARGDSMQAGADAEAIQRVSQQYNGIVAQLRTLEGPSSVLAMLDRVGDVLIQGAKVGATKALGVVSAGVNAATSTMNAVGTTAKILPWALVGIAALLAWGLASGKLKLPKLT